MAIPYLYRMMGVIYNHSQLRGKSMTSKNKAPVIKSVCTDMLNINLQLNEEGIKQVEKNLIEMSEQYGITPFTKYGYREVIPLLTEEQKKSILFCSNHKYPSRPYVHLQLNPSELDKTLATSLRGDLDWLLGNCYKQFFLNSSVTRLDIAVDYLNLNVDDCLFNNTRQRRSAAYFNQSGQTESVYLGHRKSLVQMRIYDKSAKNRSKHNVADTEQVTRIEATVNPKCTFADIHKIKNPYEGLKIYKLSGLIADNRIPLSFCDSIQLRGLTATLNLLAPDERKAVKSLLEQHVFVDFPADQIFQLWKASLKKIVPLKYVKP